MRAALLPTPGDPFLLRYWLRNYTQTWRGEVDELRILINGQTDPAILDYIRAIGEAAGAIVMVMPQLADDHGHAIGVLIEATSADTIMLAEDDCFVRHPGMVAAIFDRLESGEFDVAGSPRGCASQEILEACWPRWPDSATSISHDQGHGLWPSFFFARRADLLTLTDRHFGARIWQAGEPVGGLGYIPNVVVSADTLVSASYQLRAAGLKIEHIPQYRIADAGFLPVWFPHDPPWFHVGSLSSGYGFAFAGETGRMALDVANDRDTPPWEWARRIVWWERFWKTADREQLPAEHDRYKAALEHLVATTGARGMIDQWSDLVSPWVTWPE